MRSLLVIAGILLQFLVLGWMAVEREWIVAHGQTVWLATEPVDPRDLFRGDYVALNYTIANLPASVLTPELKAFLDVRRQRQEKRAQGWGKTEMVIYAALKLADNGVADVASVGLVPPATGLYVKGRVRPYVSANAYYLSNTRYGIESYFVQQGKGRGLERRAPEDTPAGVQVPLEMEVALGDNGSAVLKGYRWSPLGMRLEVKPVAVAVAAVATGTAETAVAAGDAKPAVAAPGRPKQIRLSLYNTSEAPFGVVLPADLRSLHIDTMTWAEGGQTTVRATAAMPDWTPTESDVIVLQPHASREVVIDPCQSQWFVRVGEKAEPRPIGSVKDGGYQQYRLVYSPPSPERCKDLPQAVPIWHGRLASRMFSDWELQPETSPAR
ncbi:MAG: hypothetical protein A3K19_10695 [Lentisphaerae bacterium RIFOXYB12_FULL_65_16]|nr:MAG: hypothetical protein A3K18_29845 [Lentisphaerae bacterium RIFOXYA12_64_32]OGV87919.1 MAG: hypothetical protein A3K19_10695 [Lentisphaerae bacterium RIFOXYB12_FULL_65_16]